MISPSVAPSTVSWRGLLLSRQALHLHPMSALNLRAGNHAAPSNLLPRKTFYLANFHCSRSYYCHHPSRRYNCWKNSDRRFLSRHQHSSIFSNDACAPSKYSRNSSRSNGDSAFKFNFVPVFQHLQSVFQYQCHNSQMRIHAKTFKYSFARMASFSSSSSSTAKTKTHEQENEDEEMPIHHEPEYLEIVSQTADRMRSEVRAYVEEYSSSGRSSGACTNLNDWTYDPTATAVATSSSSSTTNNTVMRHNSTSIKLVGILATTTTHPPNTNHHQYCNDTHGNERYSEQIFNSCTADGILYEPWRVPPTREAMERAIHHANERLDVHGILVFYPVFDKLLADDNIGGDVAGGGDVAVAVEEGDGGTRKIDSRTSSRGPNKCEVTGVYYKSMDDYFRDLVMPEKDVEGHCRRGLRTKRSENNENDDDNSDVGGPLVSCATHNSNDINSQANESPAETVPEGRKSLGPIYPCTALAVFRILESFQSEKNVASTKKRLFENTIISIINRSEVLGLPLATMLSNQGATVYSIDVNSVLQFLPNGKIRREPLSTTVEQCIRQSSVVVSGVPSCSFCIPTEWIPSNATVVNVATEKSNFDEETLVDVPGVTYVPHVGRVTVSALEYNLMCLHRCYHASS